MFHTELLGVLMICLHAKFHILSSNGPLVLATKPKMENILHAAAMFLFSILQKQMTLACRTSFKIYYRT